MRNPRTALPAAQLYALLAREFELARDFNCRACHMPLPMYRKPADEASANWHAGTAKRCPFLCHLVIAEVQARLQTEYDIVPPL